MVSRKSNLLALTLVLGLMIFSFPAADAFAEGGGGGVGRVGSLTEHEDLGDHGGGDPDNPVPCDGGSGGEFWVDEASATYIGTDSGQSAGTWMLIFDGALSLFDALTY